MQASTLAAANPFGMLIDPEATLRAIEESHRISAHRGRICRPLDRPQIPIDGSKDARSCGGHIEHDDTADETDDASLR